MRKEPLWGAGRAWALALAVVAAPVFPCRAAEPPALPVFDPTEHLSAAPTCDPLTVAKSCCTEPRRLQLSVGERNWISWGESSWSFAGIDRHPSVLSELQWHDVQTTIQEFNVDAVWNNRFVLHTDVGFGWFYGGRFRDSDYAGENRTELFSDAIAPVDTNGLGEVYVISDIGFRVFRSGRCAGCPHTDKFTVDALIGYQFWREKYRAVNVLLLRPPLPVPEGPAITETFIHDCFRVGGRAHWQFLPQASLDTRLMIVPWAYHEVTDDHYFRPDLGRPADQAAAQGGFGYMLDTTASYHLGRGLSLTVGYQLWQVVSGQGGDSKSFTIAPPLNLHLNEINTFRHGALFGVVYRF